MKRINIAIPDALHRKIKSKAARDGLLLKDFVIKSLERSTRKGIA